MAMATQIAIFVVVYMLLAFVEGHDNEIMYGYKGEIGPENWGNLSPAFPACSRGKTQSPVNIVKKEASVNESLGNLNRDYRQANATLFNNGVNIGIEWSCETGFLTLDGKNYTLKESLWHTPSEHTINGARYAAELQHFHQSADGQTAVVTVLYEKGDPDQLHTQLIDHLAQLSKESCAADEQAQIAFGNVDSKLMTKSSHKYYRYMGSLTIPPCTENITWLVIAKVREMSSEQIEAVTAPLVVECKSNARPTQPLNARQVQLYDGDRSDSD